MAPLLYCTVFSGDDQMFTPPATDPPLAFSMFTPLALDSELPASEVLSVFVELAVEPATAIFPDPALLDESV